MIIGALSKLFRLSPHELLLFLEANFFLTLANIVRITVPLRWYAPFLGKHMNVSKDEIDDEKLKQKLRTIVKAIQRGCKYQPFSCKCLVQAMAGKAMLRLRRICSTVYLGVAKDEEDNLIAHAWVRVGNMHVTGGRGTKKYKVISTFAEDNSTLNQFSNSGF